MEKTLASEAQAPNGESVKLSYRDQGSTSESATEASASEGIELVVIKLTYAKRSLVLLPKRWVLERSFGGLTWIGGLPGDEKGITTTFAGLPWFAWPSFMLQKMIAQIA